MSLAAELAARLRSRIDAGELAPGDRLPPVRELATTEHVSAAVAGEAYAMLARESRVVSRVGRGTYVARPREGDDLLVELVASRRAPAPSAILDLQERLAGAQRAGAINLSAGLPVVDDRVAAAVSAELEARRARGGRVAVRLRPAARRPRPARAGRRRLARAAACTPTRRRSSSRPRASRRSTWPSARWWSPATSVLCETPTYAGAVDALVASRARIVPIPVDAHGLRVEAVAEAIRLERPRLLFANPTGNNATGTVLSDERRARLAALSAETGLVIIEDDTGAELVHDGPVPAPIAAFDPEAPIILVKSYAKTVLPGLRLGVILPPPHLDRRVLAAKLVADRYTSPPLVRALAGYLARPEAARNLERTRLLYRDRRDAFLRSLERRLGGRATWLAPRAGFNLWLRLPDRVSEEEIFARGVERGVIVSPGPHLRAARRAARRTCGCRSRP